MKKALSRLFKLPQPILALRLVWVSVGATSKPTARN